MAYITLPAAGSKIHGETTAASEFIQRLQLVRDDNSGTPLTADGSGLQVQLGAAIPAGGNNIGLVTLAAGSAAFGKLAANSGIDIGDVDVLSLPTLPAGTNYIGKARITDGTTDADVTAAGTYKGVYTALLDQDGEALSFALPLPASVSPTMDAATYVAGDSLQDAAFSIASAVTANGRTCHLLGLSILDKDDQGIDLVIDFFRSAPTTVPAAQDPYTLDDTDSAKVCGFIDTSLHGEWRDLGGSRIWQMTRSPIVLRCTATTLYLLTSTKGTPTYTASGLVIEPSLARD
jgi:hypothetical protein